jgi:hypothetical protein
MTRMKVKAGVTREMARAAMATVRMARVAVKARSAVARMVIVMAVATAMVTRVPARVVARGPVRVVVRVPVFTALVRVVVAGAFVDGAMAAREAAQAPSSLNRMAQTEDDHQHAQMNRVSSARSITIAYGKRHGKPLKRPRPLSTT